MNTSPSIDPEELARFEAIATTWWEPEGPFWPLHLLNKVRVAYLQNELGDCAADPTQPFAGCQVLDIGCGGGLLSEAMAKLGAQVTGVDVVARNIDVARRHAAQSKLAIHYELISAEQLAARQPASFDLVLNMEVVEHVADLDGFMASCCALVKPGGQHVVATINRNPWAWFSAVFMAEQVLGLLPKGTHHWAKLRKPRELKELLRHHGFHCGPQTGIRLNPFNRRMTLTTSTAINYLLIAEKSAP